MARQRYSDKKLSDEKQAFISTLDNIVEQYKAAGYRMTVRQVYYQAIAKDLIPDSWVDPDYNRRQGLDANTKNTVKNYKRLAGILDEGKMAGLIDWEAIEDRTREFVRRERYEGAHSILEIASKAYHMDMWVGQPCRVFVIVEKEALAGVLEPVCREYDVPLLAARGYPSGTVLREFAESDLAPCFNFGPDGKPGGGKGVRQEPVIIHLGDHDPSGIDMSRDLAERFLTFVMGRQSGKRFGPQIFRRVALNMDQIEDQQPPPNPAKATDARFADYQSKFGDESWELDALEPDFISNLVRTEIKTVIEKAEWTARKKEIEGVRKELLKVAADFKAREEEAKKK